MAARLIGSAAIAFNGYQPPRPIKDLDVIGDKPTLLNMARDSKLIHTNDPMTYLFGTFEYKVAHSPAHHEILSREGKLTPLGIEASDMQTLWAIKYAVRNLPVHNNKTTEDLQFFNSLGIDFDDTDPLIEMIATEAHKRAAWLLKRVDLTEQPCYNYTND